MAIVLKKSGWQTLVMDQGRRFTRHLGIPTSGVTDLIGYWWANGLVGHHDFSRSGAPVLEIRTGSVEILFKNNHTFALTGSEGDFFLDDARITSYHTHQARKNQTLYINSIHRNGTIYLAIEGTWKVTYAYGSASADILSPFPGTAGGRLKNGECIEIIPPSSSFSHPSDSPERIMRNSLHQSETTLRILAGPELNLCTNIKKSLLEYPFTISRKSNRMGYRLLANQKLQADLPSMVSSVVIPGMIQWPGGNDAILLLPNCQTTGGYPRVAKVIDADLWKLAYIGAGDHLCFKWSTPKEALYLKTYETGQFTQAWDSTFQHPVRNHRLMY